MTNRIAALAGARLDVRKYLQYYEIPVHSVKIIEDGRTCYRLTRCPFDASHRTGDAAIFQDDNGKLSAKCLHDSCAGRGWSAFREQIGRIIFEEHMVGGGGSRPRVSSGHSSPQAVRSSAPFDLETVSNAELYNDNTKLEFLIQDILVAQQPCTLGGSSKTLKTSIAVDLAISVASERPFLGQFAPKSSGSVFIISAESGKPVLRDLMRTICGAKGLTEEETKQLPITWSFKRPQLANPAHLLAVRHSLETISPKLVVLDPSYLLVSGAGSDSTKNLFAMGDVLGAIADTVTESCGATLMLLHHVNKSASRSSKGPSIISLADLAYAGFVEWTRQWILLSRTEAYTEGTGIHRLHMSAGGSAGHSGAWSVQIKEGHPMRGGRKWDLQVVNTNSEPSQDNSPLAQFVQVLNEYPEGAPRSELEKLGLVDSVLNGLMQEMEYGWNSDRSKIIKKEEA